MRVFVLLALFVAAVSAVPTNERIVGGSITNIESYSSTAALLSSFNLVSYEQTCGSSILNSRAILTAAQCMVLQPSSNRWRVRVGSTFANNGGVVHNINQMIVHPNFVPATNDADIAILQSITNIVFNDAVAAASIAGANYNLQDNQDVWAVGWGATSFGASNSPQLRHVQIWTVNQATCRQRYAALGRPITDNMLCAGWLDVGGRDQCTGDVGGPLYHNGVVVGVTSFRIGCAQAFLPGVNTRVSRYTNWIQSNA